ncbi:hypothetical protein, partial [Ruminococcus flavefaciens]|uniref:hypothetical protein n=1 Tax=Ruminococcus flavefaciens TaxID=1265 RepID=UPI00048F46C8
MKKLNLYKKVIAMLSGISLIFTSVSTFYTPFIVFADGDPPSQSLVEALDPVTELHWVEDSSATVTWTVSAEANYYAVTVDVYESDGITFIGSSETGTTATEIDVQQEIHNVIGDAEYDVVKVKATVIAQKKQDDVVVAESDGITTGMWMYLLNIIQIPTPTKIELSEDLILTFECDIANPANIIS